MDASMEIAYSKYNLSRQRADELMKSLKEMYIDTDMSDKQIISWAFLKDKIISEKEYNLLKEYY